MGRGDEYKGGVVQTAVFLASLSGETKCVVGEGRGGRGNTTVVCRMLVRF